MKGNSSLNPGKYRWVLFNKVIPGLRLGIAFSRPKMELVSECKGPLSLANVFGSEIYQSNLKTNYMVNYCLRSGLLPPPPLFSPSSGGWAAGESLQDKQITDCHGPRATQLHSQTSPAQAVHLMHAGHRLFQLMPLSWLRFVPSWERENRYESGQGPNTLLSSLTLYLAMLGPKLT